MAGRSAEAARAAFAQARSRGVSGRPMSEHLPAHSPSWQGLTRSVTEAKPTGQEWVKRSGFACCSAYGWIR